MVAMKSIADLCIYILTWNVGSFKPNENVTLNDALSLQNSGCKNSPDVYAISLQEVNSKPSNQILGLFQDDPWVLKVRSDLSDRGYVKVDTEQMQGLLIMIFAKEQHIDHMRDIETEFTRTGFLGAWGNKGAVSVRMSLYGTGVVWVGAHLAAHTDKLKDRVADYNQIVNNHNFGTPLYHSIFDHDLVFWFGDLNFRLDMPETSNSNIKEKVMQGNLAELLKHDQLLIVHDTGNAFSLMTEQTLTFPPTFKFKKGTSEYDLKRAPAWCDRILYRITEDKHPGVKLTINQLSYKSYPQYINSDHKPVSAEFMYKIGAEHGDDSDVHQLTHGGANIPKYLLSVIIFFSTAFILRLN